MLSINQSILDMKKNTRCIDERLDGINDKVNQTALEVELYQETLIGLLPTLASLIDEFIWSIVLSDVTRSAEQTAATTETVRQL